MTELTDEAVKALLDGATPRFLIRKHGGYYRPNCQGYTSSAILAGRYTEAKAISETHPNGPNGPRDGMTYTSEDAITDEDFAAYIALREQRDDLARALLASRAELARVKADAAAAQARGMERAAKMLESRAELLVQDEGSWEPDTNVTNLPEWAESECEVLEESARLIRDLAPVDGLALVAELRAERDADKAHVLRLLLLASERDRLVAELATANAREVGLRAYLDMLLDGPANQQVVDAICALAHGRLDHPLVVAALAKPSTEGGE